MSSKHREALISIQALLADEPDETPWIDAMKTTVDAALAEPLRNCDVGTAEEQTKRLREVCNFFKPTCLACPYKTDVSKENCWLAWSQMPYESEVK